MIAPAVAFRPVVEADRDRLLAWRNAPEVAAFMYSDHLITPEEHDRWFGSLPGNVSRAYWIIEMDAAPVGLVNLYDIDETAKTCAWAYYLADPATRGRGVGSFVEYRMIEHVFTERGLERLGCEVLESNEAVWKLHQSFGFQISERLPAHVVKGGEPLDVVRMALTPDRWTTVRAICADRLENRGFDLSVAVSL
jgi:UDP-4-amino-4,6-dideoxy-N-acetyl-beta-L-altrosamine N-acetyltransferase